MTQVTHVSISGNSWHNSLIGKQQGVGRAAISRSVGHGMDENEAAISWPTSSAVAIHRNRRLLLIRNTCYNALRKLVSTTIRIKRFIHYFLLSFLIMLLLMFFFSLLFSLSHLLSSFTKQVGSCWNACNVCSGAARLNLGWYTSYNSDWYWFSSVPLVKRRDSITNWDISFPLLIPPFEGTESRS